MKLVFALYAIGVAAAEAQPDSLRSYRDPQSRFQFTYPGGFGAPAISRRLEMWRSHA